MLKNILFLFYFSNNTNFIYIAPLKTGFTTCFDRQSKNKILRMKCNNRKPYRRPHKSKTERRLSLDRVKTDKRHKKPFRERAEEGQKELKD